MRRREFLGVLGGGVVAWPVGARAQQPMPVLGYLSGISAGDRAHHREAFRQGLNEAGYIEDGARSTMTRRPIRLSPPL